MKHLLLLSVAAILVLPCNGFSQSASPAQAQPGEQRPAMPFGSTADRRSQQGNVMPAEPAPVRLDHAVQEQEHPQQRTGSVDTPMPDLLGETSGREARSLGFFENKALANNPTLQQAQAQVTRLRAEAVQAGLWQNPEIGYEADHIRGGSYAGGEQGGYVQQIVPLAGQRSASRAAVEAQARQAEAVLQQQQERVRSAIDQAFYAALAAEQEVALRTDLARVASDSSVNAHQLANVGQADAPDVLQSEVEREQSKLELATAQRGYRKMFAQLAALSGDSQLEISPLTGDLEAVPVLAAAAGTAAAEGSPALRVAEQQVAAQDAAIRSVQRQQMPELRLHAGLQQDNEPLETGGRVGVVGVAQAGITLPLWNRNQGAVAAARVERVSAEAEVKRTRLLLHQLAAQTAEDYANAMSMARAYREELLPRAERAEVLYKQKYAVMAAGYPQVLLAEKMRLQLRVEYLHALSSAWQNAILLQHGLQQDGLARPATIDKPGADMPAGGAMR